MEDAGFEGKTGSGLYDTGAQDQKTHAPISVTPDHLARQLPVGFTESAAINYRDAKASMADVSSNQRRSWSPLSAASLCNRLYAFFFFFFFLNYGRRCPATTALTRKPHHILLTLASDLHALPMACRASLRQTTWAGTGHDSRSPRHGLRPFDQKKSTGGHRALPAYALLRTSAWD